MTSSTMPTTSEAASARTRRATKLPVTGGERRGEIGAEHVERAVRQVDEVHDAEDERQAGGQQKQQHAELHAVEALLDEIQHACVAISRMRRRVRA